MNLLSGPPLKNLRKGWALLPFVGNRAHYWIEDTEIPLAKLDERGRIRYYQSKCRLLGVTRPTVPALEPGNWPRCKRCEGR